MLPFLPTLGSKLPAPNQERPHPKDSGFRCVLFGTKEKGV